jgi:hypothetical protein
MFKIENMFLVELHWLKLVYLVIYMIKKMDKKEIKLFIIIFLMFLQTIIMNNK